MHDDPRDKSDSPTRTPNHEFEPEDFSEQGDDQVLTTPPAEVEESFEPESEIDTDTDG
jgi:hypothetical protein